MTEISVPTIDFEPFQKGGASDRATVARAIDAACMDFGIFAITGHGVAEDTIEALREEAVRFFARPEPDKSKVARPADKISRGWNFVGDRSLAYSLGRETPPDLQESFAMGPVGVPDAPYYSCDRARAFFAPNLWPDDQPELRAKMTDYFHLMESLAQAVMQAFALALGRDATHFDHMIDRHTSSLRLIRYPGQVHAEMGQRRAGEHTDYGSLTILRGDNVAGGRPGGLQVKLRHGDWVDITRPDSGFVCNIGDAMARWTNDRWVSNLHRVGAPGEGQPSQDRISIVFFHNPNYDAEMRCITADDEAAKYPAETFDQYFIDKLNRGSFGKSPGPLPGSDG